MKKAALERSFLILAGVLFMVFGGNAIARHLAADTGVLSVAMFALGILMLSRSYVVDLRARVAALEAKLATNSTVPSLG